MKTVTPPPFDKLYWLRVGLGIVAGFLAWVIPGTDYINGFSLAILVYLISYYFGKLYTTGLGVYIGLFLFTWILLFTQSSV
jgi:hypothetical protein